MSSVDLSSEGILCASLRYGLANEAGAVLSESEDNTWNF
jgi:hypothetical protein